MITEQQKAQKAINLANLLEQKYGNIPEVQELVGKVRAKFAVSEQKPKPRSYGIGGEYGKPPGFREKLSQQMQMGVIPPPGYDVDPATGEYIKRNEWRWYDPLRGIGKVAEGIGGFIPSMAVYPEGIPEMIKGTAAGVGESWKRLAGASPLSPHYDPMASLELAQDPVGNLVMSTLPVALAFGGVKGARKLAGKPKVMPKEAVKPTKIKEATEPKVTETPREFKEMPKAKPTGKQPWEMTREEARNKEIDLRQDKNFAIGLAKQKLQDAIGSKKIFAYGSEIQLLLNRNKLVKIGDKYVYKDKLTPKIERAIKEYQNEIKNAEKLNDEILKYVTHEDQVKQALSEGKPVPAEVLKDYPDLVTEAPREFKEMPKAEAPLEPIVEPKEKASILPPSEFPPERVPVNKIGLKPKEIQFKLDINAEGVQKPLKGEWSELAAGNILLWQDKSGKYYVANGHHRLALAKQKKIKAVNAQVLRESDGYTINDARRIAAETNIMEGRGTVYDQAEYFRLETQYTPEVAESKGLTGQGYTIGKFAEADLYDSFRNRKIKPEQAEAIAGAAPNDPTGQRIGQEFVRDNPKSDAFEISAFIQAARIRSGRDMTGSQEQLFSNVSSSELAESARIARAIAKDRRELMQKVISARSAVKRPAKAGEMGVKFEDIAKTKNKIQNALIESEKLKKWYLDPELVKKYREKADLEEIPLFTEKLYSGVDIVSPIFEKAQPYMAENPATRIAKIADESVRRYVGERELRRYQAGVRAHELKEKFKNPLSDRVRQFFYKEPKETSILEDMTFYRQKTHNPKIKGDTFEALSKRLPPEAKAAVEEFGRLAEEWRQEVNSSGFGRDVNYVENWIHQRWKIPRDKARRIAGEFVGKGVKTRGAFENKRVFENFVEGMDKNYEPRTLNFAELVQFSENAYAQVIASRNLVKEIWNYKKQGITAIDGRPALELGTKAPADYVRFDHPALKKFQYKGETKKGAVKLVKEDIYMHPEFAPYFKAVFDRPFGADIVRNLENCNQVLKGAWLRFSLFHNFTLSESSAAMLGMLRGGALVARLGGGIPGGRRVGNIIAKLPGIKQAYKKLIPVAEEVTTETAKQWIRDGLRISPPSEASLGQFKNLFVKTADALEKIPMIGKPAAIVPKVVVEAARVLDRGLWADYHTPIKTIAAETIYRDMIKLKEAPKNKISKFLNNAKNYGLLENVRAEAIKSMTDAQIRREVASVINDGFGGQMWELMQAQLFRDPKARQILHLGILSPDWVISQLRVAADVAAFKNPVKQAAAIRYWRNAAFIYFISTNTLNYLFTAIDPDEKAHFCFQNEPGRKFDIQLPGKNVKGRKRYISPGKQFREVPRMMNEGPLKWVGHKASPVLTILSEQFTGYSPSGFPSDLARARERGPVTRSQEHLIRLGMLGKQLTPFSLRGSNVAATFPFKKGINTYKAREYFEEAYRTGNDNLRMQTELALKQNGYSQKVIKSVRKKAYNAVKERGELYQSKGFIFQGRKFEIK